MIRAAQSCGVKAPIETCDVFGLAGPSIGPNPKPNMSRTMGRRQGVNQSRPNI